MGGCGAWLGSAGAGGGERCGCGCVLGRQNSQSIHPNTPPSVAVTHRTGLPYLRARPKSPIARCPCEVMRMLDVCGRRFDWVVAEGEDEEERVRDPPSVRESTNHLPLFLPLPLKPTHLEVPVQVPVVVHVGHPPEELVHEVLLVPLPQEVRHRVQHVLEWWWWWWWLSLVVWDEGCVCSVCGMSEREMG